MEVVGPIFTRVVRVIESEQFESTLNYFDVETSVRLVIVC